MLSLLSTKIKIVCIIIRYADWTTIKFNMHPALEYLRLPHLRLWKESGCLSQLLYFCPLCISSIWLDLSSIRCLLESNHLLNIDLLFILAYFLMIMLMKETLQHNFCFFCEFLVFSSSFLRSCCASVKINCIILHHHRYHAARLQRLQFYLQNAFLERLTCF